MILVINSGSSSIKYALFDTATRALIFKGKVERIGEKNAPATPQEAMKILFEEIDKKNFVNVEAVGHRIVHGGEKFRKPVIINEEVIAQIKLAGRFVPLHYLPNLTGIEAAKEKFPSIPHVAVFDTGAYADLPQKAFLYGIPVDLYEKHQIRKYGFHGINHEYVAEKCAELLKREKLRLVSCHLGNGCSITAFEDGKSIDTSMGLTPLEGLMMGSRCGDIDPSVVLYCSAVLGLTTDQITELLNQKSGFQGYCGSNDMRDIHTMAEGGNSWGKVAIEMFVYRIQKYIGAYIAALKGVDAIAFTGGIGENDAEIRESILSHFEYMGVAFDREKNLEHKTIFSRDDSKVVLLNIEANEELMIAKQTESILNHKAIVDSANKNRE